MHFFLFYKFLRIKLKFSFLHSNTRARSPDLAIVHLLLGGVELPVDGPAGASGLPGEGLPLPRLPGGGVPQPLRRQLVGEVPRLEEQEEGGGQGEQRHELAPPGNGVRRKVGEGGRRGGG